MYRCVYTYKHLCGILVIHFMATHHISYHTTGASQPSPRKRKQLSELDAETAASNKMTAKLPTKSGASSSSSSSKKETPASSTTSALPKSAYFFWLQKNKKELVKKFAKCNAKERVAKSAEMWKEMADGERQSWVDMFEEHKKKEEEAAAAAAAADSAAPAAEGEEGEKEEMQGIKNKNWNDFFSPFIFCVYCVLRDNIFHSLFFFLLKGDNIAPTQNSDDEQQPPQQQNGDAMEEDEERREQEVEEEKKPSPKKPSGKSKLSGFAFQQ